VVVKAGKDALLACHAGYLWIHEATHNLAHGLRIEHGVGIGHDAEVCFYHTDAVIEGCRLTPSLGREYQFHLRIESQASVGLVGTTVSHPHHVQLVGRIV